MKSISISSLLLIISLAFAFTLGFEKFEQHNSNTGWLSLQEAQQKSKVDGKPLFVFVEAEWCGICRQMLQDVFPNEKVAENLSENYHPVIIDLDSKAQVSFNGEEMTEREFVRKMEVVATPTTIFIDSDGIELGRQLGGLDSTQIIRLLAYVASDQFFEVSLEEFEMKE